MEWLKKVFSWLNLFIKRIFGMKLGNNSAGRMGSKEVVRRKKEIEIDEHGNEIPGTINYQVLNSSGAVLKESSSLKEIFYWLDEHSLDLTLG